MSRARASQSEQQIGREASGDIELENAGANGDSTTVASLSSTLPNTSNSHPGFWQKAIPVAAGFTVCSMTCSIVFSYGVYEALYEDLAEHTNTPFSGTSSAVIGLIGVLAIAFMTIPGPVVLLWAQLYSPQLVVSSGGLVFASALVLASFGRHPWHFALTQGLLAGVGSCMSYVITSATVPTWFDRHRGLALGAVIAGTGVGGMIWPPILRSLIVRFGFRNTLRISGCVSGTLVGISGYFIKWEPKYAAHVRAETQKHKKRTFGFVSVAALDWKVASSGKFLALATGNFLQAAAYSTPLIFYASFAQSRGYSATEAANFITLSNASNFISRIAGGYAADRMGRLNALSISTILSAVAVLGFWLPSATCDYTDDCDRKADILFIIFTVLYGGFASAYISLFPASLLELFGVQHYANVNGALMCLRGLGALLGTPLTALLIPGGTVLVRSTAYEKAALTVGMLMAAVVLFTGSVRIMAVRTGWKWKV
ncbi:hypothetical protein LTR17_006580 [Elasticomyces elasticus]|nr:hypothetical protein LTR17_006580 [Elasticomyces elasticus]